jgi:hypothetical protein
MGYGCAGSMAATADAGEDVTAVSFFGLAEDSDASFRFECLHNTGTRMD